MSLKRKAPLLVLVVAILTSLLSGWSSYASNLHLLEACKQADLQTTVSVIQESLREQTGKAAARAGLVASMSTAKKGLRAKDAAMLGTEFVKAFQMQRDQYGVREAQFHLPPAFSLLRLLGKTIPMEDLSAFREMVVVTNRRREPQRGIEIGRRGLSIRGIYPVIDDDGQHVGSFEVGMDFGAVMEDVKRVTGDEVGVFVDAHLMAEVATSTEKPDQEHILGSYQNVDATNWQAIRPMVTADMLSKSSEKTFGSRTVNGVEYGIVIVPMLDFRGKHIGAIVAVKSYEEYQQHVHTALVGAVACTGLQAVLLIGTVLIVFNGMLMRPVERIGRALAALADGERKIDLADLPKRSDEVGAIARDVNKLAKGGDI